MPPQCDSSWKNNKSKSNRAVEPKPEPITVSQTMTMRQFYDCGACVILMDKVTLNRIASLSEVSFIFPRRAALL